MHLKAGQVQFRMGSFTMMVLGVMFLCARFAAAGIPEDALSLGQEMRHVLHTYLKPHLIAELEDNRDTGDTSADALAKRVEAKLEKYRRILERNVEQVQAALSNASSSSSPWTCTLGSGLPLCSDISFKASGAHHDSHFGAEVKTDSACIVGQDRHCPSGADLNADMFKKNLQAFPNLKWQYIFHETDDTQIVYPATGSATAARSRSKFFQSVHRDPLEVIVVFDHGQGLSPEDLELGRLMVKDTVKNLGVKDRLGFIAVSDDLFFPLQPNCQAVPSMRRMTKAALIDVFKFLNVVHPTKNPTSHAKAFQAIRTIIANSELDTASDVHVILISRGTHEIADEEETQNALTTLRQSVSNDLVISCVRPSSLASRSSDNASAQDKQYLMRLCGQDMMKFNSRNMSTGRVHDVGHPEDTVSLVNKIFAVARSNQTHLFSPKRDVLSQNGDFVFNLVRQVHVRGDLVGVAGVDIPFRDLMEDIIFASQSTRSFTIAVESFSDGMRILTHPSLGPDVESTLTEFIDLKKVLSIDNYETIADIMLFKPKGVHQVRRWSSFSGYFDLDHVLSWSWVGDFPIMIVKMDAAVDVSDKNYTIAGEGGSDSETDYRSAIFSGTHDFFLVGKRENFCRQFRSLVTLESGSLSLSPAAFVSPALHLEAVDASNQESMTSFMAYLTDHTNLISNPGLKGGIKEHVTILSQLIPAWRKDMLLTDGKVGSPRFIVKRYAGHVRGVRLSYPGAASDTLQTDFFSLPWFSSAVNSPGQVILSPPRLSDRGGGHVVSASRFDSATGTVLGLDMTLYHLERIILDVHPGCHHHHITCILFDESGHLVYHPLMTDPGYFGPIAGQHLSHKEPNLAKSLLEDGVLVKKSVCRYLSESAVKVVYSFDKDHLTQVGLISGTIQGRQCNNYQVSHVSETNVFFGVINSTCTVSAIFCPCNINTEECLICPFSLEGSEASSRAKSCECPCKCSWPRREVRGCDSGHATFNSLPVCEEDARTAKISNGHPALAQDGDVEECFPLSCSSQPTQAECQSSPGCFWCEIQLDQDSGMSAFSPVAEPFCANGDVCFRGVVDPPNPYDQWNPEKLWRVEEASSSFPAPSRSPLGPIIGGVLVVILFVSISVFCFRRRLVGMENNRLRFRNVNSSNDNNVSLRANIEVDEDEDKDVEDFVGDKHAGGVQNVIALNSIEAESSPSTLDIISPYQMNPSYRRAPPGSESDHGYSTMTAVGDLDSDVAKAQPRHYQHRPQVANTNASVTSGLSSRTSSPLPRLMQTKRRECVDDIETKKLMTEEVTADQIAVGIQPHQFIVAATVHMEETAS